MPWVLVYSTGEPYQAVGPFRSREAAERWLNENFEKAAGIRGDLGRGSGPRLNDRSDFRIVRLENPAGIDAVLARLERNAMRE